MTALYAGDVSLFAESSRMQGENHFALQQYQRSIKHMRKASAERSQSVRTMLLGLLLFTFIEAYHGNFESAAQLTQAGLNLIDELHRKFRTANCAIHATSPARHEVEDELCEIFDRLDMNFSTVCLGPSPRNMPEVLAKGGRKLEHMPERFESLIEGRAYLALIGRQSILHRKLVAPYAIPRIGSLHQGVYWLVLDNIDEPMDPRYIDILAPPPDPRDRNVLPTPPLNAEGLKRKLFGLINRWEAAFEPLRQQATSLTGREDYMAMLALRLHFLSCFLTFVHNANDSRLIPNIHIPKYAEVISIAREQLSLRQGPIMPPLPPDSKSNDASAKPEGRFSLDSMNILALFNVARRCPDMSLRREAIDILAQTSRNKWAWNSICLAKVGEFLLEVEEEAMLSPTLKPVNDGPSMPPALAQSALTPEQIRVDKLEVIYSLKQRKARLRALQKDLPTGRLITEKYITW